LIIVAGEPEDRKEKDIYEVRWGEIAKPQPRTESFEPEDERTFSPSGGAAGRAPEEEVGIEKKTLGGGRKKKPSPEAARGNFEDNTPCRRGESEADLRRGEKGEAFYFLGGDSWRPIASRKSDKTKRGKGNKSLKHDGNVGGFLPVRRGVEEGRRKTRLKAD